MLLRLHAGQSFKHVLVRQLRHPDNCVPFRSRKLGDLEISCRHSQSPRIQEWCHPSPSPGMFAQHEDTLPPRLELPLSDRFFFLGADMSTKFARADLGKRGHELRAQSREISAALSLNIAFISTSRIHRKPRSGHPGVPAGLATSSQRASFHAPLYGTGGIAGTCTECASERHSVSANASTGGRCTRPAPARFASGGHVDAGGSLRFHCDVSQTVLPLSSCQGGRCRSFRYRSWAAG